MALRLIKLQREDVKLRTIFDCLGVEVDVYVCYTGEETYVLCDKKDRGDYRIYLYQGKDEEESFFDENNRCLLLPEYTFRICPDKEQAVLCFVEAIKSGYVLVDAIAASKDVPNPLHFGITLHTWVQEEIRNNKRPDETENEFVERVILEACQRKKNEIS